MQIAQIVSREIPEAIPYIHGGVYSSSSLASSLSVLFNWLFWLGLLLVIVVPLLIDTPLMIYLFPPFIHRCLTLQILPFIQRYQFAVVILVFSFSMISTQLQTTGAFEVFINQQLVWSKLQTGQLPNQQQLIQQIKQMMGN